MRLTLEDKLAFVESYRRSGSSQDEFCASYTNFSPRTLRSFIRETRRPPAPAGRARAVVAEAIAELQALLAAMDTQVDGGEADQQGDVTDDGEAVAVPPSPVGEIETADVHAPLAARQIEVAARHPAPEPAPEPPWTSPMVSLEKANRRRRGGFVAPDLHDGDQEPVLTQDDVPGHAQGVVAPKASDDVPSGGHQVREADVQPPAVAARLAMPTTWGVW